jgi:restriction system protein
MEIVFIIIIIIAFLLMSNKKTNNNYEENKRNGDEYEKKVGKYYEEKGYIVDYNGLKKGLNDGGIDLICKNENEILLIQCKNWKNWKVKHIHVKAFHSDSIKYIDENNLKNENVKLKYVVLNNQILHNSAIQIFRNRYYNCRYEIV